MKYPLYCFRDVKAGSFSPPLAQINEATAKRDFEYRLHNDNGMGFAPSDYELYYVGEFDSDRGTITPLELPEFIVSGGELY